MSANVNNSAVCNNIQVATKGNANTQIAINKQFDALYAQQHKVMTSSLSAAQKEAKLNALNAKGEALSSKQAGANLAGAKLERQAEKAGCDRL